MRDQHYPPHRACDMRRTEIALRKRRRIGGNKAIAPEAPPPSPAMRVNNHNYDNYNYDNYDNYNDNYDVYVYLALDNQAKLRPATHALDDRVARIPCTLNASASAESENKGERDHMMT